MFNRDTSMDRLRRSEIPLSSQIPTATHTRQNLLAMLAAVAMFFSTLEFLIPKPVPFFRVGLANLPLLLVLDFFTLPDFALLVLLKVVGQGLINGTLASYVFLFSFFGSAASAVVMVLVHRIGGRWVSLVGVSTAGALASNLVQISLSVRFIFGPQSWIIAPPFLTLGVAAGVTVGVGAQFFRNRSAWLSRVRSEYVSPPRSHQT